MAGISRGGIAQTAAGNYESLTWGIVHELAFRYGGATVRNRLSRMVARSSWHYLTPEHGWRFKTDEFDRQVEHYRLNSESMLEKYIFPGLKSADRVLEFGCGIGVLGRMVAIRCANYVGVDVSRGAIRAAAHWSRHLPNATFRLNNGFDLGGIKSESVDFIFTHQVIQHLDKIHAYGFFEEFFRVLAPGGRAAIHLPMLDLPAGLESFVQASSALRNRPVYDLPIWQIRFYTAHEANLLLRRAGFEEVKFQEKYIDSYYCHVRKPASALAPSADTNS